MELTGVNSTFQNTDNVDETGVTKKWSIQSKSYGENIIIKKISHSAVTVLSTKGNTIMGISFTFKPPPSLELQNYYTIHMPGKVRAISRGGRGRLFLRKHGIYLRYIMKWLGGVLVCKY